ncbi:hypothetical protein ACIOHC_35820 [Streptomyces sp. NPDC088252]|uniref:hypothetical protein n=1 Tax=Streptomyces sp. NPDC088252 TaxID=3365845 RepID=UPI0038189595
MNIPENYRGIPVPPRLRQYWNKPTGRWWRQGIDAAIDAAPFYVEPGQVYADNDYRMDGRTLRVDRVENGVAHCTVLTNYKHVDEMIANEHTNELDKVGTTTQIRTRRFTADARGYRLLTAETHS